MVKIVEQTQKVLQKKTYLSDMLVGIVPKNIDEKAEKAERISSK